MSSLFRCDKKHCSYCLNEKRLRPLYYPLHSNNKTNYYICKKCLDQSLKCLKHQYPLWQYHPQENIGYVDIDVNFIIGGAQGCHLYYWSNWEQKIIDPRRDLLEHGINTKCKSNGTLDKKKLYSFLSNPSLNPNRLYPIDLVCIMREGHKKEYFVCDDGHRRVSLAHKYELSKIKALVRVVYYDRG